MTNQVKKQTSKQINNNLIEQLKGISANVGKTMGQDVVAGIGSDILDSLFGTPKSGNLKPNQSLNFGSPNINQEQSQIPQMPEQMPKKERFNSPFSNEILQGLRSEEALVAREINEIRLELRALIAAVNSFNKELEKAAKEEIIDPGVYHLSFLDRIKTILKLMRKSMNESCTWLNVMRSRRKERRYWNQYKKKGTMFGLSSERTMATQTG